MLNITTGLYPTNDDSASSRELFLRIANCAPESNSFFRFRMFTNPGKVEVQGVVYNTFKSK